MQTVDRAQISWTAADHTHSLSFFPYGTEEPLRDTRSLPSSMEERASYNTVPGIGSRLNDTLETQIKSDTPYIHCLPCPKLDERASLGHTVSLLSYRQRASPVKEQTIYISGP